MRRGVPAGLRRLGPSRAAAPGGRWIVALPAWGERYAGVALRSTLPALIVAVNRLAKHVELHIWTDRPQEFAPVLSAASQPCGWVLDTVPGPDGAFESLSNCHRAALATAVGGDRVLLLTADMVLSREVLVTAEAQIASGKRCVCCVAPRAIEGGAPIGASGRELLAWAWANRHRMTRECTWPEGRSYDVWRMYFERGGEVAARVFLPHPLVCVPAGRRLHFAPTIDVNLAHNFSRQETYLITQPEEGAAVELSPPDKEFLLTEPMRDRADAGMGIPGNPPFVRCSNPRYRMFFEKRVVFCGTGAVDDAEVVRRMLG